MEISCAQEKDLPEVASFYSGVGYTGGVNPADKVLVARTSEGVVGAVRLCEEEGCLVLRGMYVSPGRRGTGVGIALLSAAGLTIGRRECWCIPYAHLRQFYGREGFMEIAPNTAPPFLVERSVRYQGKGEVVVIMVRPSN
jgi:GNAT superfamily N-acetyltransferase